MQEFTVAPPGRPKLSSSIGDSARQSSCVSVSSFGEPPAAPYHLTDTGSTPLTTHHAALRFNGPQIDG
ncbi:hypothetical protein LshimejAT787_1600940 [Lyophyllum shimeji]|uniref:Uncharacterized protein n=1 Tax=Lyophyllum shimeji TaxID=47721 RepID=A0A9P3PYY6_LYOSH|nr:hypothetical protein LshimejAT787_1600940 [Lyophyllum shimeji]